MNHIERRSTIKRKSVKSIQGSPLHSQWLVIFPYELEFSSPFDSNTVFYFQKNYQVIGDLRKPFPPSASPTKYFLTDLNHMITFRLFNLNNLNYKWTMYRLFESGQEQFIQQSQIDIKNIISSQVVTPTVSQGSHIQGQSSLLNGWITKQFQAKFSHGVVLKYNLYVFDDLKMIEDHIKDFLAKNQQSQSKGEASKSSVDPTPNIGVSSNVESQARPSNQGIQTNIMNTPQETEEIPQSQPNPQIQEKPVQQQKPQEKTPQPQVQQSKEEAKSPSMLRLESKQADLPSSQQPKNQLDPGLDVVAQETERPSYTPDDAVQGKPQQQEATPGEQPAVEVVAESPIEKAKSIAGGIDLKKVIIVLLLVIIGLLGVVVFKGRSTEQKENVFVSKKKKSKQKKK